MINLFYIEDHPVTVTGFRTLFRPSRGEIQLMGSASSVDEAITTADPATFTIILLDLWLDENDPFVNIRRCIQHFRTKFLVIYSGETRIHFIKKAFQLGVRGYLYKSLDRDEMVKALRRINKGEIVYPEVLRKFMLLEEMYPDMAQKVHLTERQKCVLTLLCQGFTIKEIAEEKMFISISLVEKTLSMLRSMYIVRTNFELIAVYMQQESEK
ncbi:MAG: response regulator transcription factor [Bacteroidota bacterium]